MDKFKEILHKMEVVIENDEGVSMSVFKALKYGLKVAIKERDELKLSEGKKQVDTTSKLNMQSVNVSFDFAKYLIKNYTYYDNTNEGDIYKNIVTKISYNEHEIIQKWNELNSR